MLKRLILTLLCCWPIFATSGAAADGLMIFAGSASQPVLEEAVGVFEAKTGIPVALHLGGSGAMLSQARLTGQGDLYIPGSPDYMAKARDLGLIEGDVVQLAFLVPAIIVARGNPAGINGLEDLARPGLRVGLADPDGVCVGLYAVEVLEANDMTAKVRPNLLGMVESCAKTAAMISLNQVDAVLGWREFAAWKPTLLQAVLLDPARIPRLAYIPGARLRNAANPQAAQSFLDFLASAEGRAIFHKWGYFTTEKAARELAPESRIGGRYQLPEGWR